MIVGSLVTSQEWAQQQWGGVDLGDKRRNRLAVEMGRLMAEEPEASLPQQMKSWSKLKGAYGILNHPAVSLPKLLEPHLQQTKQDAGNQEVTLFVEDTTELDYTAHPNTKGLGPIGDGRGRGLLLHSTLAVEPKTGEVLGVAHSEVVLRQATKNKRPKWTQSPEGAVWETSAKAVGSPPEGVQWVHVSDRGSDTYSYLARCHELNKQFLIRVFRNRKLIWDEAESPEKAGYLIDYARQLPIQANSQYNVNVAATKKQPNREAQLVLSWSEVSIGPSSQAPPQLRTLAPLHIWVVRAWEPNPPEGVEPVEWVLLTSCPVTNLDEARQRVAWYSRRWLCEDFFQCLKTGCRIEQSQLDHGDDIRRLLGFSIPIAARLLQLRQAVRLVPDELAVSVMDLIEVTILANQLHQKSETLTIAQFWQGVAQLGGHLGRRRDGPPGWRTLWRGWKLLSTWAAGARMLSSPP